MGIMPQKISKKLDEPALTEFARRIDKMPREDLKDFLLINTYKLALARAQIEAITEVLIKNKLITYEEFWKKTNEILKDSRLRQED